MIFCSRPSPKESSQMEWVYVEFLNRDGRVVQGPYKSNTDLLLLKRDLVSRYSLSAENIIFHYMKTLDLSLAGKVILNRP